MVYTKPEQVVSYLLLAAPYYDFVYSKEQWDTYFWAFRN